MITKKCIHKIVRRKLCNFASAVLLLSMTSPAIAATAAPMNEQSIQPCIPIIVEAKSETDVWPR